MRVRRVLLASMCVAAVGGGVTALQAGGQSNAGPPTGTLDLTLTYLQKDLRLVDAPPKSRTKNSAGDVTLGLSRVADATGRRIGTFHFERTKGVGGDRAAGTVRLPQGTLAIQELIVGSPRSVEGIIVGGTGRFAGARGTVSDRAAGTVKGGERSRLTFRFLP